MLNLKQIGLFFLLLMFFSCDDSSNSALQLNLGDLPSAPESAAVTPGDKQLTLSWAEASLATDYQVWYSESNDSSTAIQGSEDLTETTYVLDELQNATTYYIWIKSINSAGTSDFGDVAEGTPNVFTITYNIGTGNSSGTVPLDSSGYIYNQSAVVLGNTGSLKGPEIPNGVYNVYQDFDSWNTATDGSGTAYTEGSTITVTQDTILYAIYENATTIVGKTGPAGGIVFYDDEVDGVDDITGYRFLEVGQISSDYQWCEQTDSSTSVGTATGLGTGKSNTDLIVSTFGSGSYAAKYCDDLLYGGYSDWFLPSIEELNLLVDSLSDIGSLSAIGVTGRSYILGWSSSEYNASCVYIRNSDIGTLLYPMKYLVGGTYNTFPIRQF